MLARDLRRGLSILALAAFGAIAATACTFPTVDYDDSGPTCSVVDHCAEDATRCGDDARRAQMVCAQKCSTKPAPTCSDDCEKERTSAFGTCNAECQSCGQAQGCANATASCKALVGSG